MFEKPTENKDQGPAGDGAKKIYKRARRKDIPPAKRAESPKDSRQEGDVVEPSVVECGTSAARSVTGARQAPAAVQASAPASSTVAVPSPAGTIEDRQGEHSKGETGADKEVDSSVEIVRDGIARVSLGSSVAEEEEKQKEGSTPSPSMSIRPAVPPAVPVAASSTIVVGGRPPGIQSAEASTAENVRASGSAAVGSEEHSSATRSSDWGSMRFAPKSAAGSTVALHASLAAAAAADVAVAAPFPAVAEGANAAVAAVVATAAAAAPVVASPTVTVPAPSQEQQSESLAKMKPNGEETGTALEEAKKTSNAIQQTKKPVGSSEPPQSHSIKKGVSFAAGTKPSPPDTVALAASPPPRRTGSNLNSDLGTGLGGAGPARGPGSRGSAAARGQTGRGRGWGNAKLGAERPKPMPQKPKAVLGAVMEKTPAVPAPMAQAMAAGGAGGDAAAARAGVAGAGQSIGSKSGLIEGHLPRIQADLSFRVMPRGYEKEMKRDDDYGGGGEDDDAVRAAGRYNGGKQEKEEDDDEREDSDDESEELGETDGEDDDENDK